VSWGFIGAKVVLDGVSEQVRKRGLLRGGVVGFGMPVLSVVGIVLGCAVFIVGIAGPLWLMDRVRRPWGDLAILLPVSLLAFIWSSDWRAARKRKRKSEADS
jgi:hypothetical protein